ncbi:hypothetical protein GCM10010168_65100 [Actinoplanes ianthinogenes]|uniref:Uncharacterized protein n=1 Tax=Actinoplanes ianthinogenes TaxID=122358 RepID=A0ABM7LS70_9ACTN|nr:hypothetical protein Aiant_27690 [Actinoplanes ianthinogenes]GGR37605.1 hypothetical protein GCM10010168_65100 [Actinoplanes ianthinogenes]
MELVRGGAQSSQTDALAKIHAPILPPASFQRLAFLVPPGEEPATAPRADVRVPAHPQKRNHPRDSRSAANPTGFVRPPQTPRPYRATQAARPDRDAPPG